MSVARSRTIAAANGLEYPVPPAGSGLELVPCDVAGCGCEGLVPRVKQTAPAKVRGRFASTDRNKGDQR